MAHELHPTSPTASERFQAQIQSAARLFAAARYAVALTGAGLSTPSGIPDFRSPGTGLWAQADPLQVASAWGFRRQPTLFYRWVRPLANALFKAIPNPAHLALADLEAAGRLQAVITQNIDGLHQRAGSRRVIELHGHIRTATCTRCYTACDHETWMARHADEEVPRCACGGVLKPDVILFGEDLPRQALMQALQESRACDLMLVAGTSLEVAPACDLPALARRRGAALIIVNGEPTALDAQADVALLANVAVALPALARAVLSQTPEE